MARTNTKKVTAPQYTHNGALAKKITPVQELERTVLANMLWEDTFYENGQAIADRIAELCKKVTPKVLSEVAIKARTQFHLRHVPLLLTAELAKHGGPLVAATLSAVIQRADELSEFLAIYWKNGKCPLSAQVKKGLARAFNKFDEYQLAKYNRDHAIKLRDVLFLVHAKPNVPTEGKGSKGKKVAAVSKPNYKRGEVLRHKNALTTKLATDTLANPDTFESRVGSGENKVEVFKDQMKSNKLGGLAFLRNLRFMNENKFSPQEIAEYGAKANFNRVLPFRFIAAARAVPAWEHLIEPMMFRALENAAKLPGKTAIVVDNSGSMYNTPISAKSDIDRIDAACALAILLREICEDTVVIGYGGDAKVVPSRRGFALADAIKKGPGGSTDTRRAVELANKQGYDRIIVITDEQSDTVVGAPKGIGYFINVSTYKNGIGYGAWNHIDGFSEAVVDWIQKYEGLQVDEQ